MFMFIVITISLISIIIVAICISRSDKFSETERVNVLWYYVVGVVIFLLFTAACLRDVPGV